MCPREDVDTSRTRVQTYVPAYQKQEWRDHADELDASLSEFVRSMVQAGRRGFRGPSVDPGDGPERGSDPEPASTPNGDRNSEGLPLEDRVVRALREHECPDWDELVDELTDDLEETLQELQAEDRVTYSGRHGGYQLE